MRFVYIDGKQHTAASAYRAAVSLGFDGSEGTFYARLRKSDNPTWDDLIRPVDEAHAKLSAIQAANRKARAAKEREEMAALCAKLDARKAALRSDDE